MATKKQAIDEIKTNVEAGQYAAFRRVDDWRDGAAQPRPTIMFHKAEAAYNPDGSRVPADVGFLEMQVDGSITVSPDDPFAVRKIRVMAQKCVGEDSTPRDRQKYDPRIVGPFWSESRKEAYMAAMKAAEHLRDPDPEEAMKRKEVENAQLRKTVTRLQKQLEDSAKDTSNTKSKDIAQ